MILCTDMMGIEGAQPVSRIAELTLKIIRSHDLLPLYTAIFSTLFRQEFVGFLALAILRHLFYLSLSLQSFKIMEQSTYTQELLPRYRSGRERTVAMQVMNLSFPRYYFFLDP